MHIQNVKIREGPKCLNTYIKFLFEAGQKVHSIYYSLNITKLQFQSCLNHLTRPKVSNERTDLSLGKVPCVNCGVIHFIFNILKKNQIIWPHKIKLNKIFISYKRIN